MTLTTVSLELQIPHFGPHAGRGVRDGQPEGGGDLLLTKFRKQAIAIHVINHKYLCARSMCLHFNLELFTSMVLLFNLSVTFVFDHPTPHIGVQI